MPHPTCQAVFPYEPDCGQPAVARVRFHDPPDARLLCWDCSLRAMRILLGTGHVFTIGSEPRPTPDEEQTHDPVTQREGEEDL